MTLKFKKATATLVFATLMAGMPLSALSQYYEDDIYYNPDKAKKVQTKKVTVKDYVPTPDYPAADTYKVPESQGKTKYRDVDEYNRRGMFAPMDTVDAVTVNADTLGEFLYTHRLERFHNPDVVTDTKDPNLVDYYYNLGYQDGLDNGSSVNLYVNSYDPFWYPSYYFIPRTYWDWGWNWGYNPWYYSSWNWGLGWGYDPYWSWSWGWGPGWGWGGHPGYYPPVRPGGGVAWRPSSPGASRPHPVAGAGASTAGRRPGAVGTGTVIPGNNSVARPGNMGRGRYGTVGSSTYRPGNTGQSSSANRYTPQNNNSSNSNSTTRPGNMGRGRSNYGNSSSSYSGSSWGGSRSSGGSFGGGSRVGGGAGGSTRGRR